MFNIFYRARGQEYRWGEDLEEESIELESSWIIQREGSPEYDSGFTEIRFNTYAEATEYADGIGLVTHTIDKRS